MTHIQKVMIALPMIFCFFPDSAILHAQFPDVIINEFLASNQAVIKDPQFLRFADWLELHNTTSVDVDISGYFLTDNLDDPSKWQFPANTIIPVQSYLLVWADGEDVDLHTNFRISKSGEELALFDPDTVGIDSIRFSSQQDDISFGRLPENGSEWVYFSLPTPGVKNDSENTIDITPEPLFSIQGGFYSGDQTLRFVNAGDVEIYYSLDGTPPDDTSTQYTNPITINTTTPIRAIAYQGNKPPSGVITNTYFIDIPVNLPVISLVTDPDNFFDDEIGIYVTGVNGRGGYCAGVVSNVNQDWERPINIELYEMDGSQGLNQRAGVKIFGGCSRHRFPQKSLALFARRDYGKGTFRHRLFVEKDIDRFESFVLRSAADDQVRTMYRDAAAQTLMIDAMDADYQAYRPVVVYLNGDYWGIHNIREKLNEHYIAGNFNVDPMDVNILANDGSSSWNTSHGSNSDYRAMMNFVTSNSMVDQANYERVRDMMDVDQYIDYMIGHIYLAERDWPGNNIKFWKANNGEYTRWRWINFDLDQTLTSYWITENMIDKTTTDQGQGWPNPEWSTRLFRNLLDNREFRHRFINKYSWHMSTTFDSIRVIGIIDSLADGIRAEIPNHIEKWGGTVDPTGSAAESWIQPTFDSVEAWENYVNEMRIFARERQRYTVRNVIEHFGLSGASQVDIDINIPKSGVLAILGRNIPEGFHGIFFNDVPVQVSATPLLGYTFSHWEANSDGFIRETIFDINAVWKYHDLGEDLGTAWAQPNYDDGAWASGAAQLGYGDGDESTVVSYGDDAENKHITTYFRMSFELTGADNFVSCDISVLVDDGAVIYLNGTEIVRVNMPDGVIEYSTTAPGYIENENAYHNFTVPVDLLVNGKNVIAAEIHQSSSTSSDLSFDCSLTASKSSGGLEATYDTPDIEMAFGGDITLIAYFKTDTVQKENLVVISEINYQSATDHDTEDWIELYNNSGAAIEMTDWKMIDSTPDTFLFPDGFLFGRNEYLVLCRDSEIFHKKNPSVIHTLGDFDFGLSSTGELIGIVDNKNSTVDEVEYKVDTPWPENAGGTGYTIELTDVSVDNNAGSNWVAHNLYGTPGKPYSVPVTMAGAESHTPVKCLLHANYPNPFNPITTIEYSLSHTGYVDLSVYNVTGQKVVTIISKKQLPGDYMIRWDARDVVSGIYFYRLSIDNAYIQTRKMAVVK